MLKILYEEEFAIIADFFQNKQAILADPVRFTKWQDFLDLIVAIEKSIPTYEYYETGEEKHDKPFKRSFTFARARLEETAVEKEKKKQNWQYINPTETLHDYFHSGAGTSDPDFIDENGNTHDVKHNNVDWENAHKARFIDRYSQTGVVEVHDRQKIGSPTGTIVPELCFECQPVPELFKAVGLEPLSHFDVMTEQEIEDLLCYKR